MSYLDAREQRVIFVYRTLLADGLDEELAELAALAMFPPTDEIRRLNKAYYKELKRAATGFAKSLKKLRKRSAGRADYEDAVMDTLNHYAVIAERRNDSFIRGWADMLLKAHQQR